MGLFLETIVQSTSLALLSPVGFPTPFFGTGSIGDLITYNTQSLVPAVVGSSIGGFTSIIGEIWAWLLFNIITPVMVIVILILFFVAQYYLIKMYIFVIKNVINKILDSYTKISNSKKFNDILSKYKSILE